jgi:hypothetical protein
MFVRGGVYKVVHEAMVDSGEARLSLMFDYVLTGPISAVSAVMAGLINETEDHFHITGGICNPPCLRRGSLSLFAVFLAQEHCRHARIK